MNDAPAATIAPPDFLGAGAPAAILAALPDARAVGGCVRDTLAGLPVHDVDIAAPLPPDDIARRLEAAGLKVFATGLKHGTVTAVLDHDPVEVTSLRRDVLTDGRHAEVAWTTDWQVDAARRDFTINAMSLAADGRLWDYFEGRDDLAAGRVRFVGDPATRLAEDYLRAMRFFRFWARFGRGEPDADALAAIRVAVPGLVARIARERIWMELKRLLGAPDPVPTLGQMREVGLLQAVLPEAGDIAPLQRLVERGAPADPMLRLAALLEPDDVVAVGHRLRLSSAAWDALTWDTEAWRDVPAATGLRMWVAERTPDRAIAALWLAEAHDGTDREALRVAIGAMDPPVFPLRGRDLMELGLAPGPELGRLMNDLREWWIDDGAVADSNACIEEAKRRMAAGAAYGSAAPT